MLPLHSVPVSRERAWRFLGGAALVVLLLIVFSRSFGSDLVFDGAVVVGEDPRLREINGPLLQKIFTENYWWPTMRSVLYRPVTTLCFLIEQSVFGFKDRAAGYQLINLAMHASAVLLCFGLLRKMGAGWWAAWLAAAWFGVHPFATEIVPNVVGLSDVQAVVAILLGMHIYLDVLAGEMKPKRGLILLTLVGLMGAFSKESSVSLLGLLVWHGLTLGRESLRSLWKSQVIGRRELVAAVLVFGLILAAVIVPKFFFKDPPFEQALGAGDNPLRVIGWMDARLNAFAIMGRNMLGCIVPLDVSGDYSYNQIPVATLALSRAYDLEVLAWAVGTVLFGVGGLLLVVRWPALSFAIGAVFIVLLPTANVIVLIGTIRADRLVYPAVLPMVLCCGLVGRYLAARLALGGDGSLARWHWAPQAGYGVALCVLAAFTHFRGSEWRTDRQFWQSLHATAPDSHKAKSGWAASLSREGNLEAASEAVLLSAEAVRQVETATDIKIRKSGILIELDASTHVERGLLLLDAGRRDEALADFHYAETVLEPHVVAVGELNADLAREVDAGLKSRGDATLQMHKTTIMLSKIKRHRGDKKEACVLMEKYLRFNRLNPDYLQALGRALVDDGQWEAGLGYLLEAAVLKPTETVFSGEAAWVWRYHTLPPSALPLMTPRMEKAIPVLPNIDLGDEALADRTKQAARRVAAVLGSYDMNYERSVFIRQVRFRIARPDWDLN